MKIINKQEILQSGKVIVLALMLTVGIGALRADWSAPSSLPPACTSGSPGCDAPINVSSASQTKIGGLVIGTGAPEVALRASAGSIIAGTVAHDPNYKINTEGYINGGSATAGGLCIRGVCKDTWPSGGGTGGIGGSGTTNYIPFFSPNGTTLSNSIMSQSSTNVKVAGTLQVTGGTPSNGKVFTATGTGGQGDWRSVMLPYGTGTNQTTGVGATISFAFGYLEAYGNEPGHNIGVDGSKWSTSWAGDVLNSGAGPTLPGGASAKWLVNLTRMDQIGDSTADREMYTATPYVYMGVYAGGTTIGSIGGVPPTSCLSSGNDYDCGETRFGWALRIE